MDPVPDFDDLHDVEGMPKGAYICNAYFDLLLTRSQDVHGESSGRQTYMVH